MVNEQLLAPQSQSAPPRSSSVVLLFACTLTAALHSTLAFIPPTTSHRHQHQASSSRVAVSTDKLICNANQLGVPSTLRADRCISTKLWAEKEEGAQSTPKAASVSKGSETSTANPAAGKKSKSKSKTTTRKATKNKATQSKKMKQSTTTTTKVPLEISAQSLSPSQVANKSTTAVPPQAQGGIQEINENEDSDSDDDNNQNYAYNQQIPTTGYSLADKLENTSPENKERFETTLTPIVTGIIRDTNERTLEFEYDEDGFPISFAEVKTDEGITNGEDEGDDGNKKQERVHEGVARIDTMSTLGNVGEEPVRWLVSLGEAPSNNDEEKKKKKVDAESFALIDLPPYSDRLAEDMRYFMDPEYNITSSSPTASLDVILLTNQQCIHYDSSPAVYVTRKSDLAKWKAAFPSAEVVMYRLDIPRECRDDVTQVLDGYGPWGWDDISSSSSSGSNKFVETGRPLTIEEWDDDTKTGVLKQGELPPDDLLLDDDDEANDNKDDELYSSKAMRKREENHRLLAIYTPGHTFGSVTYVFPQRGICCSGYTLPLESSGGTSTAIDELYGDDDFDDDEGNATPYAASSTPITPQGPRLDYQGYLATSASRPRQMSSALSLINNYIDRFRVVLPARGDVVFLDSEKEVRKKELMESVGLYKKIGDIYNRLGIVE